MNWLLKGLAPRLKDKGLGTKVKNHTNAHRKTKVHLSDSSYRRFGKISMSKIDDVDREETVKKKIRKEVDSEEDELPEAETVEAMETEKEEF